MNKTEIIWQLNEKSIWNLEILSMTTNSNCHHRGRYWTLYQKYWQLFGFQWLFPLFSTFCGLQVTATKILKSKHLSTLSTYAAKKSPLLSVWPKNQATCHAKHCRYLDCCVAKLRRVHDNFTKNAELWSSAFIKPSKNSQSYVARYRYCCQVPNLLKSRNHAIYVLLQLC